MTRAEAVRYGNIVSTQWNGEKSTGCYLGNGRFGAILSGLGLNLDPETQKDPRFSQSHINHMNHWGRFNFFSPHVQADSSADYAQLAYDRSLIEPSGYADRDWAQFYETSDAVHMPFYLATHGMITQSLIRNCVNDYWGKVDLASCLPQNAAIRFENIRTRLGVSLSGKAENGFFTGTVTALRDCSVTIGHEQLTMTRGETRALTLSLNGN